MTDDERLKIAAWFQGGGVEIGGDAPGALVKLAARKASGARAGDFVRQTMPVRERPRHGHDRAQSILGEPHRFGKILLVKVHPFPAAIDDDKVAHFAQRDQRVMPDTFCIVHPPARRS